MANNQINKLLEFANMQMAAEAFLVEGNEIAPAAADVPDRLRRGNAHASRFTEVQATQFIADYEVVTQYRNDSLLAGGTGFSATLFKKRGTEEYTLSDRRSLSTTRYAIPKQPTIWKSRISVGLSGK